MTPQAKADRASRVLRAMYAKRMPCDVLRRAERLAHNLSNAAFEAKYPLRKAS